MRKMITCDAVRPVRLASGVAAPGRAQPTPPHRRHGGHLPTSGAPTITEDEPGAYRAPGPAVAENGPGVYTIGGP